MRITGMRSIIVELPTDLLELANPLGNVVRVHRKWDFVICYLHTDEGITGMGYVWTPGYGPYALKSVLDTVLAVEVTGENPLENERLWHKMWGATNYFGRRGLAVMAMTAVDVALWDIKGKAANLPWHQLFGAYQDKVPVYASGGFVSYTVDELVEEAVRRLGEGFWGYKMFIGHPDERVDVQRVAAVRRALGDDVRLMVDANQAWGYGADALRRARLLEEFGVRWLEEPLPADDVDGMASLRRRLPPGMPVAGGENAYTKAEIRDLLEKGAVDILQPDLFRVGGITEFLKVMGLAQAHNVPVAPHIATELSLPLVASFKNGLTVEYMNFFDKTPVAIFAEPLRPEGGFLRPCERPGHGVEFHPETVARFRVA